MKVIIAGGRTITDISLVYAAIAESGFEITEVVSGGADGVDKLGEKAAMDSLFPVKVFKADWDRFGRSAGPKRNREMATYADALIAIWDGKSRGTKNMIETAKFFDLKVYVKRI